MKRQDIFIFFLHNHAELEINCAFSTTSLFIQDTFVSMSYKLTSSYVKTSFVTIFFLLFFLTQTEEFVFFVFFLYFQWIFTRFMIIFCQIFQGNIRSSVRISSKIFLFCIFSSADTNHREVKFTHLQHTTHKMAIFFSSSLFDLHNYFFNHFI